MNEVFKESFEKTARLSPSTIKFINREANKTALKGVGGAAAITGGGIATHKYLSDKKNRKDFKRRMTTGLR